MSIMISELYAALREAGSTTESARSASQAVADLGTRMTSLEARMTAIEARMTAIETEVRMLKWMIGFNMILLIALLGINFQIYLEVLDILKAASLN